MTEHAETIEVIATQRGYFRDLDGIYRVKEPRERFRVHRGQVASWFAPVEEIDEQLIPEPNKLTSHALKKARLKALGGMPRADS